MNKILYVEDNYQNYRLVMRFLTLEKQQYDIVQAPTGNDGIRMASEMRPDLILMDINLPDIDGIEVTRQIKENPNLKHIPVVALTANAMVGDQERVLSAGCDAYLRKPMSRADLHGVLIKYLSNGHSGNGHGPAEHSGNGHEPAEHSGNGHSPSAEKPEAAPAASQPATEKPAAAPAAEKTPEKVAESAPVAVQVAAEKPSGTGSTSNTSSNGHKPTAAD